MASIEQLDIEEHGSLRHFFYHLFEEGIDVDEQSSSNALHLFLSFPLTSPLLFTNTSSDARDHCANERTFLSWLRLSMYLSIVSVAIVINFHLKHEPTDLERRLSQPLGIIFWTLSLVTLGSGVASYMRTVAKYARRRALVQSGWRTQIISAVVAVAIVATCGIFLGVDAQSGDTVTKPVHRTSFAAF